MKIKLLGFTKISGLPIIGISKDIQIEIASEFGLTTEWRQHDRNSG